MGGSFKLNCSDWWPADLSWGHKSKWKGKNFIPEFHPKYFSQQWKYKDCFSFILNIFFAGFPWTLRRCDSCFCPSQTARNVGFKTVLKMHQNRENIIAVSFIQYSQAKANPFVWRLWSPDSKSTRSFPCQTYTCVWSPDPRQWSKKWTSNITEHWIILHSHKVALLREWPWIKEWCTLCRSAVKASLNLSEGMVGDGGFEEEEVQIYWRTSYTMVMMMVVMMAMLSW